MSNVYLTRRTAQSFLQELLQVGADSQSAYIVSQALARRLCEDIPPNSLQQQAIEACQEAIYRAGLGFSEEITWS
ncbi:MAG: hypothetical protein F6K04_13835 [Leptolyngbya sp. SIO4C5]|uniref:hypothetical protein n=1 Tax=Sphaerothrix gracilis TaxID=3151835 RepID=UPI0013BFE63F|nr:hypothetical protein [Leptolyngbya sp. SIO4C5]